MSGHIVRYIRAHPMLDAQRARYAADLQVVCPFCNAGPGEPCVSSWTHPARSKAAQQVHAQPASVNNLPNYIKKALVEYCNANGMDPKTLHKMTGRELFDCYCQQSGLVGWSGKLIEVLTEIGKLRNI